MFDTQPNLKAADGSVDVVVLFRALSKSPITKLELSIVDSSGVRLVREKGKDAIALPFDLTAGACVFECIGLFVSVSCVSDAIQQHKLTFTVANANAPVKLRSTLTYNVCNRNTR